MGDKLKGLFYLVSEGDTMFDKTYLTTNIISRQRVTPSLQRESV